MWQAADAVLSEFLDVLTVADLADGDVPPPPRASGDG